MEFDEMKKIWDSQGNQSLFILDEAAMNNRIAAKRRAAYHITNFSELLLIGVNGAAGIFLLVMNLFNDRISLWLDAMAGWTIITALYVLINRIKRMSKQNIFDRSMLGDLDHAISMARYQVRLSGLMRWNIIPIGACLVLSVWETGKSVWIAVVTLVFLGIVHFASGWEHNYYVRRRRELEVLRTKLV